MVCDMLKTRPINRCVLLLFAALSFVLYSATLTANPRWHWEARFTSDQRQELTGWVDLAHTGMERLFGNLPYSFDVYFHTTWSGDKPVPWAHTRKSWKGRSVSFYVNPRHLDHEIDGNWTAYHELSHLMFPYLGKKGMWFAEGIASYLQYHVMYAAGELEWNEVIERYEGRFNAARGHERFDDYAIIDLREAGWVTGINVRLYWGGAAYFLEVDQQLHSKHGLRLHDVIRDYLDCCFGSRGGDVPGMIRQFNRISGTKVFSDVYNDTVKRKGFPETRGPLAWLRENPPDSPALNDS